jgi:hypothetical protein
MAGFGNYSCNGGYDNGASIGEKFKRRHTFKGKTVFPGDQAIHVWAQQSQPCGRNAKATVWFEGPSLYSYGTEIARFTTDRHGSPVVLLSSQSYSVTTSGQQHAARHAVRHLEALLVEHVEDLSRSVRHLVRAAGEWIADAANTRKRAGTRVDAIEKARARYALANVLIDRFGLSDPAPVWNPLWDTGLEELAATHKRALAEKAAKDAAAEAERLAKLATEWTDRRAMFLLSGERSGFGFPWHSFPCLLAVNGGEIRTSWGAQFPAVHGVRALRLICACRKSGRGWKRDGVGPRLGHFQIDEITEGGAVKAGCHTVEWSAIEHAARSLGITA